MHDHINQFAVYDLLDQIYSQKVQLCGSNPTWKVESSVSILSLKQVNFWTVRKVSFI